MIRSDHIFEDMRVVLLAFFRSLGSPFTSWDFIKDYPDKLLFRRWNKPYIWIEGFNPIGTIESQYNTWGQRNVSGTDYTDYAFYAEIEFQIGIWLNQTHGGMEEMNIIRSALFSLFHARRPGLPADTFDVTLGNDSYTGVTLYQMGFRDLRIIGDREVPTEDVKEWRRELNVYSQILTGESVPV